MTRYNSIWIVAMGGLLLASSAIAFAPPIVSVQTSFLSLSASPSDEMATNGRQVRTTASFEAISPSLPLPVPAQDGSSSFMSSPMEDQARSMMRASTTTTTKRLYDFVAKAGVDRHMAPSSLNPFRRPILGIYSDEGVGFEKGGSGLLPVMREEYTIANNLPGTFSQRTMDSEAHAQWAASLSRATAMEAASCGAPVAPATVATRPATDTRLQLTDFVRDIDQLDEEIQFTEQELLHASVRLASAEAANPEASSASLENRLKGLRAKLLALHNRRDAVKTTIAKMKSILKDDPTVS